MRFRLIHAAPLLALLAIGAWALASPVGASPDDDFHLTSTYCASHSADACLPGPDETSRYVDNEVIYAPCYRFDEDASAVCQSRFFDQAYTPNTVTERGNFADNPYPPLYYAAMGAFAGPDVASSALAMRLVNALLFVAMTSLAYALLPARRRSALVWGWLVSIVPLGAFLIASNNPSGWTVTGVGTAWIALLGYFESTGRARIGLGALFLLSVAMAAGSRADGAVYVVVAIAAVGCLTYQRGRPYLYRAIVPAAGVLVAVAFALSANQLSAAMNGFSHTSGETTEGFEQNLSGTALFTSNLLNLPRLISGVFGGFGLGWLDTILPALVLWASASVFIVIAFLGLGQMNRRKALAVGGVVALLIAIPLYVLQRGGDPVGIDVQPRYVLPLVVLLAGLLAVEPEGRRLAVGPAQAWAIVLALSIANLVALHTNIRRYVTGADVTGLDLNTNAEWWWNGLPSPMTVWLVGSLAFAGTVAILVHAVTRPLPADSDVASSPAAPSRARSTRKKVGSSSPATSRHRSRPSS
jgi:hypothetical protein